MHSAAGQAGNDDRGNIKDDAISYVSDYAKTPPDPFIRPGDKKSQCRGYKNILLGSMLMPVSYVDKYIEDPTT